MPNNEEKNGGFKKFLKWIGVDTTEEDEEEYEDEQEQEQNTRTYQQSGYQAGAYQQQSYQAQQGQYQSNPQFTAYQGGKTQGAQSANAASASVNNNRGGNPVQFSGGESKHNTNIYQLNEHGETKTVIDDLLAGKSVLINMQTLDALESQRIIDTLSGAAYAINAKIKPVAHQAYLIAPSTVEIGGNFSDENGSNQAQAQTQTSGGIGTGTISSNLYRRNAE
ncbi:MAG: cell division protein SepF [Clostridiales bacterium]|nr:cell division protein SepF [Clostridiales bacterium]